MITPEQLTAHIAHKQAIVERVAKLYTHYKPTWSSVDPTGHFLWLKNWREFVKNYSKILPHAKSVAATADPTYNCDVEVDLLNSVTVGSMHGIGPYLNVLAYRLTQQSGNAEIHGEQGISNLPRQDLGRDIKDIATRAVIAPLAIGVGLYQYNPLALFGGIAGIAGLGYLFYQHHSMNES